MATASKIRFILLVPALLAIVILSGCFDTKKTGHKKEALLKNK